MNRRQLIVFCSTLFFAAPSFAAGFEEDVVAYLRQQGYDIVTITTTMLGRSKITATNEDGVREIVLNPRTGEILRDLWIAAAVNASGNGASGASRSTFDDNSSSFGRNKPRRDDRSGDDKSEDKSDDDKSDDDKSDDDKSDDDKSDDDKSDDKKKSGRDDD